MMAAVQRERARADQFYLRARNLLAYATGFFTIVQVAFISNLGREIDGAQIVSDGERLAVGLAAISGLIGLALAAGLMIVFADRARPVDVVGGDDLVRSWFNPNDEERGVARLWVLIAKVRAEEESLAGENDARNKANVGLAALAGWVAVSCLVQLILLYVAVA